MNESNTIKSFCEGCSRKATVHITDIADGKMTETHFCPNCPVLENLNVLESAQSAALAHQQKEPLIPEKCRKLQCPKCQTTYLEFASTGLLGCSHCYEVFKEPLNILLKYIHDDDIHIGKCPVKHAPNVPPFVNRLENLFKLKQDLSEALKREDFENAAVIRDQIKKMEEHEKSNYSNTHENMN